MKEDNRDWVQSLSNDIAEFYGRLARALPALKCDPAHHPRERDDACKSCVEAREEMRQLIAEGDAGVVSIGINVYLRRLYDRFDAIARIVNDLASPARWTERPPQVVLLQKIVVELEDVFAEVLTDEDRDIPTDEDFLDAVREYVGAESNEEAARMLAEALEKASAK